MNTPVPIVQKYAAVIPLRLVDPNTKRPYDLSAVTALKTCFRNQDGTELMLSLGSGIAVVGNPILGELTVSVTAAQSALLEATDVETLELGITTTGDPIPALIPMAYQVLASRC